MQYNLDYSIVSPLLAEPITIERLAHYAINPYIIMRLKYYYDEDNQYSVSHKISLIAPIVLSYSSAKEAAISKKVVEMFDKRMHDSEYKLIMDKTIEGIQNSLKDNYTISMICKLFRSLKCPDYSKLPCVSFDNDVTLVERVEWKVCDIL